MASSSERRKRNRLKRLKELFRTNPDAFAAEWTLVLQRAMSRIRDLARTWESEEDKISFEAERSAELRLLNSRVNTGSAVVMEKEKVRFLAEAEAKVRTILFSVVDEMLLDLDTIGASSHPFCWGREEGMLSIMTHRILSDECARMVARVVDGRLHRLANTRLACDAAEIGERYAKDLLKVDKGRH